MSTIKRCAACGKQSPVSTMKTCMHAEMHNYVCDSKCMSDFYNPPKKPAPSLPAAGSAVEEVHHFKAQVLELIVDECKYWQGKDEARRGGFAVLYAKVNELSAQQSAPVCWVNDQQLLLCSKSPREVEPGNPMRDGLPRNIAGSALPTEYCNTPLYRGFQQSAPELHQSVHELKKLPR